MPGPSARARNVLVRAQSDAGASGWGECCPREYVTGESIESVHEDLRRNILPRLVAKELDSLEAATDHLTEILDGLARNQQAAFCAADLAVLDLVGRTVDRSAGDVLGPVVQQSARYSGVIATEDPDKVKEQCAFKAFLLALDENLNEINIEYKAKRGSQRLHAPGLHVMREGWYERARREHAAAGKRVFQAKTEVLTANKANTLDVKPELEAIVEMAD